MACCHCPFRHLLQSALWDLLPASPSARVSKRGALANGTTSWLSHLNTIPRASVSMFSSVSWLQMNVEEISESCGNERNYGSFTLQIIPKPQLGQEFQHPPPQRVAILSDLVSPFDSASIHCTLVCGGDTGKKKQKNSYGSKKKMQNTCRNSAGLEKGSETSIY